MLGLHFVPCVSLARTTDVVPTSAAESFVTMQFARSAVFRLLPLLTLLVLVLNTPATAQENFRPLFNGQDLSGWVLVNTPRETWSIQDGMLICSGRPTGELRTDRMYQNFILEVEWRHMVPGGNAGIFVWADDIKIGRAHV